MPRPLTLLCLALLGAAFYIYALASQNALLGLAVKPIPVLALIAWLRTAAPSRYRHWITIGLGFSLLGDILWPYLATYSYLAWQRFFAPIWRTCAAT